MALKSKYKSKEEIPAEHAGFYTEHEGAWMLDAEGMVEKTRVDEFRSTNIALQKQLDEQRKRYEGISTKSPGLSAMTLAAILSAMR